MEPVDPALFEAAMPATVLEVVAQARRGEGPVAHWLTSRGGLFTNRELSDEIVGWLIGIAMFDDEWGSTTRMVIERRHARPGLVPHILAAFTAGVVAGVRVHAKQWKRIELVARTTVPPELAPAIAIGCASSAAVDRGPALRLAQHLGEPARVAIMAARTAEPAKAERLDAALVALASSTMAPRTEHEDLLLARLLAAWESTRDPALEGPIARLGKRVAKRDGGALKASSKGELEAAWLALAERVSPSDVDRLLDTPWPGLWKAAMPRLLALLEFPPDPRIAERLPVIAAAYTSQASYPLHRRIDAVASIHAKRASGAAGEPADLELLAEALEVVPAGVDVDALYAQLARTPLDAGLRAVIADALQEAGDPRGELIVLQQAIAAGTADKKARSREAALIKQHGDAFEGPLPGVDRKTRRFAGGFLVEADVRTSKQLFADSLDRWQWSTVERLSLGGDRHELAVLRRLPSLRELMIRFEELLESFDAAGTFPNLRWIGCPDRWVPKPGTFPDLEILFGRWMRYYHQWDVERFRDIQQRAAPLGIRAIVHELASTSIAEAVAERRLGPLELRIVVDGNATFEPGHVRIRVSRDSDRADVAGAASTMIEPLARGGIKTIALVDDPDLNKEDLVRRGTERGVAVTFDGAPISIFR